MRPSIEVHDALARLLEYPRLDWEARLQEAARCVGTGFPGASELLQPFLDFARATPITGLEELFALTFDNTDERALEVGWHVYGENYTRGTFMVRMRRQLREQGLEENGELPDHLSHVLGLLGRLPPDEAGELAVRAVLPAVRKVHDALVRQNNPWAAVLATVRAALEYHEAPKGVVPETCAPEPAPPGYESCGLPDEGRGGLR